MSEEDWIKMQHYSSDYPGDVARGNAAVELLKHLNITDAPGQVDSKYDTADDNLIHTVSLDLKEIMKAITLKVFKDVNAI